MCGLKEIFEGAGNFFKKVPAKLTFPFEKIKFNPFYLLLICFACGSQHLPTKEKALKPFRQATFATFPFKDGFQIGFQFDKFSANVSSVNK